MRKSTETQRSRSHKLWIIPMVFFVAQQSHAFGLGEIQVDSYLGEPLKAQVDLIELANDYESNLKVRLASPEEYKKNGYAYPYDTKFKFAIVNENGKQPMVRIFSSKSIEDPYLNLLIEVASPAGKIIKIFTFLIDPSPDVLPAQAVVQSIPPARATRPVIAGSEPSIAAATVVPPASDTDGQQHQSSAAKSANRAHSVSHPGKNKQASGQHSYIRNPHPSSGLSGKLSLSLSTSLAISGNVIDLPSGGKENSDALQEELIAKEKTLGELNAQIAEMKTVIKGLQIKLSLTAASAVSVSGVLAQSETGVTPVVSQSAPVEPTRIKVITPMLVSEVNPPNNFTGWSKNYIKALLAGLSIIVLVFGFFWRRKRKLERGRISGGLFDDLNHPQSEDANKESVQNPKEEASPATASSVVTQTLAMGDQSMKVPTYKSQKTQSMLPPEYDLLEEADIYLRFGHDKLAEDVLRDALKINPANPEIYMTLLGIFDTRGDAKGFEKTALQMKEVADAATWKKAAESGKKLDIGNPLYD